MSRNLVETIVGALVVVVAGAFTAYAFTHSGSTRPSGYELVGKFSRIDGVKRGTDVTLAGIKVGTVISHELDPKYYQAVVRVVIDDKVKLPADTAARVLTESLLGGAVISLEPGSDDKRLKPGDEFAKTQGATPIIDLLLAAFDPANRDKAKQ